MPTAPRIPHALPSVRRRRAELLMLELFEDTPTATKVTERDMLDALTARYTHMVGNGDRWIRAEHVRNGTGFYGYSDDTYKQYARCVGPLRTADFIAIDGWESKKHVIHGHEVKVSRSDWLTELKDPE